MLSRIIVAAFLIASVIFAAVRIYWPDIIAQPRSAAAFLGALAGAGGGLLAIIFGALINAELNRRRDDRLRAQEAKSMAVALRAELHALEHFMSRGLSTIRGWQESGHGITVAALTVLAIAEQTIFQSLTNAIGLLGADLTRAIVTPHAGIGRVHTNLEGLMNQGLKGVVSEDILEIFIEDYEAIGRNSRVAIEALDEFIGHRP